MFGPNLSSIRAHIGWMERNAVNVANVSTQDYNAVQTTLEGGGGGVRAVTSRTGQESDLTTQMTDQLVIAAGVGANVAAVKTQDGMLGTLLDLKA